MLSLKMKEVICIEDCTVYIYSTCTYVLASTVRAREIYIYVMRARAPWVVGVSRTHPIFNCMVVMQFS